MDEPVLVNDETAVRQFSFTPQTWDHDTVANAVRALTANGQHYQATPLPASGPIDWGWENPLEKPRHNLPEQKLAQGSRHFAQTEPQRSREAILNQPFTFQPNPVGASQGNPMPKMTFDNPLLKQNPPLPGNPRGGRANTPTQQPLVANGAGALPVPLRLTFDNPLLKQS